MSESDEGVSRATTRQNAGTPANAAAAFGLVPPGGVNAPACTDSAESRVPFATRTCPSDSHAIGAAAAAGGMASEPPIASMATTPASGPMRISPPGRQLSVGRDYIGRELSSIVTAPGWPARSPDDARTSLSDALPPRFEKSDVLRVARRRASGLCQPFEPQQILFGRDAQYLRPDLHHRRGLHQLRRGYWKVEQEIDSKLCCGVEEIRTRRRVDAQTADGDPAVVDRREHFSGIVQSRHQLEAAIVQGDDHIVEPIVWSGNDKVEVTGDPLRPKNDQGHAPDQHRRESEVAQRLRHGTYRCEVGGAVGRHGLR